MVITQTQKFTLESKIARFCNKSILYYECEVRNFSHDIDSLVRINARLASDLITFSKMA